MVNRKQTDRQQSPAIDLSRASLPAVSELFLSTDPGQLAQLGKRLSLLEKKLNRAEKSDSPQNSGEPAQQLLMTSVRNAAEQLNQLLSAYKKVSNQFTFADLFEGRVGDKRASDIKSRIDATARALGEVHRQIHEAA